MTTPLLPAPGPETELRALLTFRKSETQAVFEAYYALRAEMGDAYANGVLEQYLGPQYERLTYEPLTDAETPPSPQAQLYYDEDC